MPNLPKDENLLSLPEIIRHAKDRGYIFGFGDPYNRLRYFIKVGLLPNMVRRAVDGKTTEGHLPAWAVERLLEIQELKQEGHDAEETLKIIGEREKSVDVDSFSSVIPAKAGIQASGSPIAVGDDTERPTWAEVRVKSQVNDLASELKEARETAHSQIASLKSQMEDFRAKASAPQAFVEVENLVNEASVRFARNFAAVAKTFAFSLAVLVMVAGVTLGALSLKTGKITPLFSPLVADENKTLGLNEKALGRVLAARTTPAILEINTDVAVTGAFNLTGAASISQNLEIAAAASTALNLTGNGAGITFSGTGDHTITTQGTSNLSFVTGGNVGIGTVTPAYKLDVVGDANLSSGQKYRIGGNIVLSDSTLGDSVTSSSLTKVGALDAGTITSGFGKIDTGSDDIITSGTVGSAGNTKFTGLSQVLSGKFTSSYGGLTAINLTGSGAGITFDSTGEIAVTAGDLILLPSGNVGVGTLTPTAKTQIVSTAATVPVLQLTGAASQSGDYLQILTSALAKLFVITSSGKVGIGTGTPTDLLDVAGGIKIGGGYAGIGTTAPPGGALIEGNVGIGTTTPAAKLEVFGNLLVGNSGTLGIGGLTYAWPGSQSANALLLTDGSGNLSWSSATGGGIQGYWSRLGTTLVPTTATDNLGTLGNVGIGLTTPTAKLAVAGNATFGTTYALLTAPTNSMIVEGNVGIGTTNPGAYSLNVTGDAYLSGSLTVNTNETVNGTSFTAPNLTTLSLATGNSSAATINLGTAYLGNNIGVGSTAAAGSLTLRSGTGGTKIQTTGTTTISGNSSTTLTTGGSMTVTAGANSQTNITGTYLIDSTGTLSLNTTNNAAITTGTGLATLGGSLTFSAAAPVVTFNNPAAVSLPTSLQALNFQSGLLNFDTTNSRVGIGTTRPGATLSVAGNQSIGTAYANLAAPSNGLAVEGNVGIGTTIPSVKLEVVGAGKFTSDLTAATGNINLAGTSGNVTVGNGSGTLALASNAFNLTTAGAISGVTTLSMSNQLLNSYANSAALNLTGNGAGITFAGATGYNQITTSNSNNLVLTAGNVGIGVTSPSFKLDVAGNANVSVGSAYYIGGASVLNATTLGSGVVSSSLTAVGALNSGSISSGFGAIDTGADNIVTTGTMGSAGNTTFTGDSLTLTSQLTSSFASAAAINLTGNRAGINFDGSGVNTLATTGTNDLAIMPGGNVGIGTSSPTSKFSVGASSEFQVNATGNLVKVNNVGYSWPGSQGVANALLANNGSGTLSWASPTGTGIIGYWNRLGTATLVPTTPSDSLANLGNTGIGTSSPLNRLDVSGAVAFGSLPSLALPQTNSAYFSGNVGIGTTDPGAYKLYVAGIAYLDGVVTSGGNVTPNIDNSYDLGTSALRWRDLWLSRNALVNGNVGVGTTSPNANLQVVGTVNVTGTPVLNLSGNNTLTTTGNNLNIGSGWSGGVNIMPGAGSVLYAGANGNVGVGTTAPSAGIKLEVAGNQNLNGSYAYYIGGNSVLSGTNLGVGVVTSSLTTVGALNSGSITNGFGTVDTGADNIVTTGTMGSAGATSFTGNTLTLTGLFTTSGNVGIGTTAPFANLSVSGATGFATLTVANLPSGGNIGTAADTVDKYTSFALNQSTSGQTITLPNPTNTTAGRLVYLSNTGSVAFTFLGSSVLTGTTTAALWNGTAWTLAGGGGLTPGVFNNSTLRWNLATNQWVENLSLFATSSGNVGIGSSTPKNALDVSGSVAIGSLPSSQLPASNMLYVSGNVGIGTTAPSQKLDVNGNANFAGNVNLTAGNAYQINSTSVLNATTLGSGVTGSSLTGVGSLTSGSIGGAFGPIYGTNVIATTGNVGVGTTGPNYKLDVAGNINATTGNAYLVSGTSVLNATTLGSGVLSSSLTGVGSLSSGSIGGAFGPIYATNTIATTGNIGVGTSSPLSTLGVLGNLSVGTTYGTVAAPAGAAIFGGNVGVGTTAPRGPLEVVGTTTLNNLTYTWPSTQGSNKILTTNGSGTLTWTDSGGIGGTGNANFIAKFTGAADLLGNSLIFDNGTILGTTANFGIGTTSPLNRLDVSGSASFGTLPSSALPSSTSLYVSGNVGLGTTNPGAKLEVAGQVKITGGTPGINKVLTSDATGLASWTSVAGVGGVSGGGTANYVARWSDSSNVTTGLMYDNGTNIGVMSNFGIGTTSPLVQMDVRGTAYFSGNVGVGTTAPAGLFSVGTGSQFQVDASGNLTKLNNVAYSWPGSQGASGTVLQNAGNGNLSWVTVTGMAGVVNSVSNADGTLTVSPTTGDVVASLNLAKINAWSASQTFLAPSYLIGNVGVGTSSPLSTLSVLGNLSVGTTYGSIAAPTGGAIFGGNVGIGTTNPGAKLDVNGGILATSFNNLTVTSSTGTLTIPNAKVISFGDAFTTSGANPLTLTTTGTTNVTLPTTGTLSTLAGVETLSGKTFSGATYFPSGAWSASGNVGIGTTSPAYNLSVVGTLNATSTITQNGTAVVLTSRNVNTSAPLSGGGALSSDLTLTCATCATASGIGSYIPRFTSATAITAGSLFDDGTNVGLLGNLGIGTTSPAYKLDVAGNINATTGNAYLINGTSVLNATTLGSGVLTSSLTGVGSLTSGSIGYNFGPIYTSGTIGTIGNIGVGITSPLNKLDVSGSAAIGTLPTTVLPQTNMLYVSGNVGIGTTAPGTKLEVAGQVKITGGTPGTNKVLTSDANGLASWQTVSAVGGINGTGTGNYLARWTDANTQASSLMFDNGTVLGTTANVGIGTTTPLNKLDVSGSAAIGTLPGAALPTTTSLYVSGNVGIGTTAPTGKLQVTGDVVISNSGTLTIGGLTYTFPASQTANALLQTNGSGTLSWSSATGTGIQGYWNRLGTNVLIPTTSSDSISTLGNVGIGTSSPLTQLDVRGSVSFGAGPGAALPQTNSAYFSGNVGIGTTAPASLLSVGSSSQFQVSSTGALATTATGNAITLSGNLANLAFTGTGASQITTAASQNLGLMPGGNVGIGTTAPTQKLDVAGSVNISTGNAYYINGTSVLNGNTLGSGILTSSLTSVGTIGTGLWRGTAIETTYGGLGGNFGTTAQGNTFYFSGSGAISALAPGTADQVFTTGGAAANPSWQNIAALVHPGVGIGTSGTTHLTLSNTGVTSLAGTTNQVSVSGATGAVTLSTPQDIHTGATPTFSSLTLSAGGTGLTLSGSGSSLSFINLGGPNQILTAAGINLALMPGGNVGIGTSSPSAKLDVSGTAKMTGFQLGTSTTAGYALIADASGVGSWQTISSGGAPIGGTGVGNYLARFQASNSLTIGSIFDNGTNAGVVSGNFGIGTTSPLNRLDVSGSVAIGQLPGFQLPASNTNMLYVSGNVGIGTTAPTKALDVNGDVNLASAKAYYINGTSVLNATTLGSGVVSSSLTGVAALTSGSIGYNFGPIYTSGTIGTIGNIGVGTTSPLNKLDVSGSVAIGTPPSAPLPSSTSLYVSGNVGIGTSNPTVKLDVSGSANISTNLTAGGNLTAATGTINLAGTSGNVTVGNGSGTLALASNAFNLTTAGAISGVTTLSMNNQLTNSYANSAALYLTGNSAGITFAGTGVNQIITGGTNDLGLIPGGNVGIGTTAPGSFKLTVAGDVNVGVGSTAYSYYIGGSKVLGFNSLGSGIVNSSLTQVGALNSGSIATGFGSIDVGSDTITTTGTMGTAGQTTFTGAGLTLTNQLTSSYANTAALNLTGTGAGITFTGSTVANQVITAANTPLALMPANGTGRVGVGTTNPMATLAVNGNAAVGAAPGQPLPQTNMLYVSGNVGIGTTSPIATLSVNGTINLNTTSNGTLTSSTTDSSTSIAFLLNSLNTMSTAGSKLLSLQNNGSEKMYLDKDGNLYVAGTILVGNGNGMLMTNNIGTGQTAPSGTLVILDTSANSSFTTTTTAYSKQSFGVVTGVGVGVANDVDGDGVCDHADRCMVAIGGEVTVMIDTASTTAATKGDYLYTSSTAGKGVTSAKLFDGLIGVVSDATNGASGTVKMIFKVQPSVATALAIDKGGQHDLYATLSELYDASNESERLTGQKNAATRSLAFDTFSDTTMVGIGTSVPVDNLKEDASNYPTYPNSPTSPTFPVGRAGLWGGRTLNSTNTDTDGNAYLGSNTVNKTFYYDRTQSGKQGQDSTPQVLVELGVDPNWFNGVSLVGIGSSAPGDASNFTKNANLSTTYNGGLIKVANTWTTTEHGGLRITVTGSGNGFITANLASTDNQCLVTGAVLNFNNVYTFNPGGACSGTQTIAITPNPANYHIGDVFQVASWYLEIPTANDRGSKAQFPERSYVVATNAGIDILDADTQKLWMRFNLPASTGRKMIGYYYDSSSVLKTATILNGVLYAGTTNNAAGQSDLSTVYFTNDSATVQDTSKLYYQVQTISQRDSTTSLISGTTGMALVNATINDVSAAVIPNQPTQTVTVSGWGYLNTGVGTSEAVNLPYKFNDNPRVVISSAGHSGTTAPVNLASCNTMSGKTFVAAGISTTSFSATINSADATNYQCYSWTATGQVSPRQYVGVATNSAASLIDETGQVSYTYTDPGASYSKVWLTSKGTLYLARDHNAGEFRILTNVIGQGDNFSSHILLMPTSNCTAQACYLSESSGGNGHGPTSLYVTEGTSTMSSGSDTLYVGTAAGLTTAQLNLTNPNNTDGQGEVNASSVKYYTKDYISEEMVGDIRGAWDFSQNATLVNGNTVSDDSVKAHTLTSINGATVVAGVRGKAFQFNGTTQYLTRDDEADLDIGSGSWSLGAWIKTSNTDVAAKNIISKGGNATWSYELNLQNTSHYAQVTLYQAGGADYLTAANTTSLADNVWHYVVGVYDGSTASLYVDGVLRGTDTTTSGSLNTDSTAPFAIGARSPGTLPFPGSIDEPFVTATALSANQIKHMYEVGKRALQGSHASNDFKNELSSDGAGTGASNLVNSIGVILSGAKDLDASGTSTLSMTGGGTMFVGIGTTGANTGWISKIDLNSDSQTQAYTTTTNPALVGNNVKTLAVGTDLETACDATLGCKTMPQGTYSDSLVSSDYITRTITTQDNFAQAYFWINQYVDSSDTSASLTPYASNDNGATWVQGTLTNTDSNQSPPEKEYFFQFQATGNQLKVKLTFARGTKYEPIFATKWGITWVAGDAIGSTPAGNGLYTNTSSSVADGSYVEVVHNQNTNDLLANAWLSSESKWKQLDATYKPAIAWEGLTNERNYYHTLANNYVPGAEGSVGIGTSSPQGILFDTFEDSTKTDNRGIGTTNVSISMQTLDPGQSSVIPGGDLGSRLLDSGSWAGMTKKQTGRVGLFGGSAAYSGSTLQTDNDGAAFLGSPNVNKVYYYDRTQSGKQGQDSTPQTQVELGMDPNWYNGVSLVGIGGSGPLGIGNSSPSAQLFSQSSVIAGQPRNPNLSTSYNGSLLKVTGTYSTQALAKPILITITKSTDWTGGGSANWSDGINGGSLSIVPGTAQALGSTGVSVTFSNAKYNVGDSFLVSSWFVEPASSTRGSKAQFPERSYVVATSSSVDIIDADTQKLWMRFTTNSNAHFSTTANSITALNGRVYESTSADGLRFADFSTDVGLAYGTDGYWKHNLSIAGRNTTTAGNWVKQYAGLTIVNGAVNDVSAAVIPNQPTQTMTVSGWGYLSLGVGTSEPVNLPYKFNDNPRVNISSAGHSGTTAPVSLASCNTMSGKTFVAAGISTTNFSATINSADATNFQCYSWTATGQVSPRQYVAVATGASADAGTTIINETDQTAVNILVGSQYADVLWETQIALTSDGSLYSVYADGTNPPGQAISAYYGIGGITSSETSWAQYRTASYGVGAVGDKQLVIAGTSGTAQVSSLVVTQGTSTIDGKSNTIYVGTTGGVTVIQEKQGHANYGDGSDENNGSVKYYTKDYISEEMVGDIRGMWPMDNNIGVGLTDISYKSNHLTNPTNVTFTASGVRGQAATFNGTSSEVGHPILNADEPSYWTIGGWIKSTGTGGTYQVINSEYETGYSDRANWYLALNGSGALQMFISTSGTSATDYVQLAGATSLIDSNWHHVVGVFDGTKTGSAKLALYVDGINIGGTFSSAGTTTTVNHTASATSDIGAGRINQGTTGDWFKGNLDELFVTATALTADQIKHMYEVGYRALQGNAATNLGGGGAQKNNQLLGAGSPASSVVKAVAVDTNNQFMYVGINDNAGTGGLSKIDLISDTNVKSYQNNANTPAGGVTLNGNATAAAPFNNISTLAVGHNLPVVGLANNGLTVLGADDAANQTSGNFVSKTYTLPKAIASAVIWASWVNDGSDNSNTITAQASVDGGSTYTTCSPISADTDITPVVPEREYACEFATSGTQLKIKFLLGRGSAKTNTYLTQYGITWLGQTGFRIEQASSNAVRVYNYTGESQNLRLDVITGGVGRNAGALSLAPSTADVDPGTGTTSIWLNKTGSGGNLMRLLTNGTDKFLVDANGNVGIGQSSPIAKLQILGAGTGTGLSFLATSATGTQNFAILDNGNVGIGTTAPSGKLDVDGTGHRLTFTDGASADPVLSLIDDAGYTHPGTNFLVRDADNNASRLTFNFMGNDGNTLILAGTSAGNIGIGTTGPLAALDVSTGWIRALSNNASAPASGTGLELHYSTADDMAYIQSYARGTGNKKLYISGSTLSLNGGGEGNVGIGTTGPSSKLTVNGASEIETTGTGNIDYRWHISGPSTDFDTLYLTGETTSGTDTFPLGYGDGNQIISFKAKGENEVGIGYDAGATGHTAKLSINGNVGIGTAAPGAQLDLSTDSARKLTTTTWATGSDIRIKTQVQSISDGLELIRKVRPVQYHYTPEYIAAHPSIKDVNYYNFIAQEYQQVFPDSVTETDGLLYLNSSNMIPYAIAGVKELDTKVTSLENLLNNVGVGQSSPVDGQQLLTGMQGQIDSLGNLLTKDQAEQASSSASLQAAIDAANQQIDAINKEIGLSSTVSSQTGIWDPATQTWIPDQVGNDNGGTGTTLAERVNTLEQNYASVSAQLSASSGQPTGLLDALGERVGFLESLLLGTQASSSATLASTLGDLKIDRPTIFYGDVNMTGRTTVGDLYSVGKISTGFLVMDSLDDSINSLGGDLKLQNSPLAENLDVFNGKVVINKNGDMTVLGNLAALSVKTNTLAVGKILVATDSATLVATQSAQASASSVIRADATIGDGVIPAGQTSLFVSNNQITAQSKVFVTAETTLTQTIAVTQKQAGQGFKVELKTPEPGDVKFSYWIIN